MTVVRKTTGLRTLSSPERTPLGRGDGKKSERTRAKIREAANRLFLARGVGETTVDAICAAAGVAKGTFYVYFRRKEDLLLEYGLQRLRRIRHILPKLVGRDTSFRDALNAILDEVVRGKSWGREVTGRALL